MPVVAPFIRQKQVEILADIVFQCILRDRRNGVWDNESDVLDKAQETITKLWGFHAWKKVESLVNDYVVEHDYFDAVED